MRLVKIIEEERTHVPHVLLDCYYQTVFQP